MRHRNHSQRLARKPNQARALLRNLATSILLYETVRTTKKRAQVVRGVVDKIIAIGKSDRTDLAIRRINAIVMDDNACRKVLEVLKVRYAARPSGFTRIVPVGQRGGDGALMCDISLVDSEVPAPATEEVKKAPIKRSAAKASTKKSA